MTPKKCHTRHPYCIVRKTVVLLTSPVQLKPGIRFFRPFRDIMSVLVRMYENTQASNAHHRIEMDLLGHRKPHPSLPSGIRKMGRKAGGSFLYFIIFKHNHVEAEQNENGAYFF